MNILVLAFDLPYPANRGGRADIWRRILSMRRLGHAVSLIAWQIPGSACTPDDLATIRREVDQLLVLPARSGLVDAIARALLLPRWPSYASARRLDAAQLGSALPALQAFRPDVVWCEGPFPGAAAQALVAALAVPLVYRSHNIEHLYMRRQASAARRWRDRLLWRVACIGLKRFELQLMRQAVQVFDVSWDDMHFWQRHGIARLAWLAPVAEAALAQPPGQTPGGATVSAPVTNGGSAASRNDVVFLGNLTTPNNVRGVEWLVREIRPLILAKRPGTRIVVAGSNPGPHVRELCAAEGVQLLPNVADALALYRSARVLVNPVQTGSGTHVKSIEMLMTDTPIVTATQGTMGMPPQIKQLFHVADTAHAFADAVLAALANGHDAWEARAEARRLFGLQGVADALHGLQSTLQQLQAPALAAAAKAR
jgi:glycosyltransferase involved in cell wall biosynthesis